VLTAGELGAAPITTLSVVPLPTAMEMEPESASFVALAIGARTPLEYDDPDPAVPL
jgi:hypothetical protein